MNVKNEIGWWGSPLGSMFKAVDPRIWRLWAVCITAGILYAPLIYSAYGTSTLLTFVVWWLSCVGIATVIIKRYLL